MLVIETEIKKSPIHGIGCFTKNYVNKGDIIWTLDLNFDKIILEEHLNTFPLVVKNFISKYGYFHPKFNYWVLCADNARFINHSIHPNLDSRDPDYDYALIDLPSGTELTCDYNIICRNGIKEIL